MNKPFELLTLSSKSHLTSPKHIKFLHPDIVQAICAYSPTGTLNDIYLIAGREPDTPEAVIEASILFKKCKVLVKYQVVQRLREVDPALYLQYLDQMEKKEDKQSEKTRGQGQT